MVGLADRSSAQPRRRRDTVGPGCGHHSYIGGMQAELSHIGVSDNTTTTRWKAPIPARLAINYRSCVPIKPVRVPQYGGPQKP